MIDQTDKCGHDECQCSAQADTGYCSDHCQQASLRTEPKSDCGCGHAGCAAVAKPQPAGGRH